jgi:predicted CoA-binding protein
VAFANPEPDAIRALLQRVKTIAVVGFSPRPGRPSHNISRQLQRFGYRIIPVRPGLAEGLGERAYPSLAAVPGQIDLANVFRASRYALQVVEDCIARGIQNVWLQEGVYDEAAAARAQEAGLTVIMDRCILRDYTRLCRTAERPA